MRKILIAAIAVSSLAVAALALKPSSPNEARSAPATETGANAGLPDPDAPLTRESVTRDPVAPTVSPPNADVTMVMFFDYACPVCRRTHPDVQRLLAQDKRIKLVYRDWPIFGGASVEAARAAIASKYQGKHAAFDDALMRMQGRLSSSNIRAAADTAGVDWPRLQADLKRHAGEIDALIARNSDMAPAIGLQGTPGFIVGAYLVPGGMDLSGMKSAVAEARANPEGSAAAAPTGTN